MLMTGVDAEFFRFGAVHTVEDYENDVGGPEFRAVIDDLPPAFFDTSARLGCSQDESDEVFMSAEEERCREWLAEGHHADEEPLLVNTALCIFGPPE